MILVDTGASGGNYASSTFVTLVEETSHGGKSIKNSTGQGYLRAANPSSAKVPPMSITGSCTIPLIFPPMDRVYEVTVRVVQHLPYSVVLGTAFMKENRSIISFDSIGGFKPSPDAVWVPFVRHQANLVHSASLNGLIERINPEEPDKMQDMSQLARLMDEADESRMDQIVDYLQQKKEQRKILRREKATAKIKAKVEEMRKALTVDNRALERRRVRREERLLRRRQRRLQKESQADNSCPRSQTHSEGSQESGVEIRQPQQGMRTELAPLVEDITQTPSEVNEGATRQDITQSVWEDEATLDWPLHLAEDVELPGGTSIQVLAKVRGPRPQKRVLLVVEPNAKYDLRSGVDIGIPRGVQFWEPKQPLRCKVTNVGVSTCSINKGTKVAIVFSMNNFDLPRLQSLLESQGSSKDSPPETVEKDQTSVAEQPVQSVNLAEANIGQLIPKQKKALMKLLEEYKDIFAINPKNVDACEGPPMILELKDPNSTPYVAPARRYTPEQRKMIQSEIQKLEAAGAIEPSTSEYASACHTVRKKDGTVRVVQDFRGLNALLKSQSGGLGDITTIMDEMGHATCFTCLDLASGFLQLKIRKEDRHLTAFRDAEGKLWQYVRCGFGLKTVPAAFASYVGGQLMPVKLKGARNWLDDIIVPTETVEGQFRLLRHSIAFGKVACQ